MFGIFKSRLARRWWWRACFASIPGGWSGDCSAVGTCCFVQKWFVVALGPAGNGWQVLLHHLAGQHRNKSRWRLQPYSQGLADGSGECRVLQKQPLAESCFTGCLCRGIRRFVVGMYVWCARMQGDAWWTSEACGTTTGPQSTEAISGIPTRAEINRHHKDPAPPRCPSMISLGLVEKGTGATTDHQIEEGHFASPRTYTLTKTSGLDELFCSCSKLSRHDLSVPNRCTQQEWLVNPRVPGFSRKPVWHMPLVAKSLIWLWFDEQVATPSAFAKQFDFAGTVQSVHCICSLSIFLFTVFLLFFFGFQGCGWVFRAAWGWWWHQTKP